MLTLRGEWESVLSGRHMDNVPEKTHVVSVMTSKTLETEDKVRGEQDDRLLLHPFEGEQQTDGEVQKTSKGSGSKQENAMDNSGIPCRFKFCKNPSCKFRHTPVCNHSGPFGDRGEFVTAS